ncbi:BON domain-containing protein [Carnimonas bestiolae]|uniref:BON domain-containing protein n=1 Tax=Carnimonas bestiolae TaxID=3402172 RepID=UPI003EDC4DA5
MNSKSTFKTIAAAIALASITCIAGCSSSGTTSGEGQPPIRSAQTVDKDGKLAGTIYSEFMKKPIANQSHVNVSVFNGHVLLTGQVPSKELKQQLADIARSTQGNRGIYDAVKIAENTSDWRRVQDTWVTSRVKHSLDIDGDRVLVLTENSTVYLMGMVYDYEANALANQAAGVSGVNSVVKAFEIVK